MIRQRCIKSVSAAFLMLAFCCNAFAQIGEYRNDVSVGANVGMTMSSMDFSPKIKQGYNMFPTIGLTGRYVCEKYFSTICAVEVELDYNRQGWKEDIQDGSGNTYQRNLSYIQLPILMQMGWGRERRGAKFIFEAGPQFGFMFADSEARGGGEWDPSGRPNDVTHQYSHGPDNKFDYGLTGGIGLELSTSIGHFILVGRYYYGLGDIYDNSKSGYFSRSANQVISVRLTYLKDLIRTKNNKIK